jgi:hypothetical protein
MLKLSDALHPGTEAECPATESTVENRTSRYDVRRTLESAIQRRIDIKFIVATFELQPSRVVSLGGRERNQLASRGRKIRLLGMIVSPEITPQHALGGSNAPSCNETPKRDVHGQRAEVTPYPRNVAAYLEKADQVP